MFSGIWQDWATLDGSGTNAFAQDRYAWLDLGFGGDVTFWLEVRAVTNPGAGNVTLVYETSPSSDDSVFRSLGQVTLAASTTPVITKIQLSTNPATPLARFVRWKLQGTAAGSWSTTFRVFAKVTRGNSSGGPTIASVDKDLGDTAGGTAITITGSGFTGASSAAVGGVNLTSFSVVNDTTITGTTGAHAKGLVDVTVNGSTGTGTLTNGFEYWNPSAVSACVWWLRADLGVTVNGSNEVTAWNDQSGIGDSARNVAPPGSNDRPVRNSAEASYNNKDTIGTFNKAGTDNNCRLVNSGAWSVSYTTFTLGVVGHTTTTSNRYFTYQSATNYAALLNSSDNPTAYGGDATTGLQGGSGVSTAKAFMMAEFNGSSSKIFTDSTETADNTGTLLATTLGNAAVNVGSYAGSATAFGVERIAELFAFNGVLSASDKVKLRKYVNDRYAKSMTN